MIRRISSNIAISPAPSNGVRCTSISYNTTPSEKTSERGSADWPSTCSGDMYFGDPNATPVWVIDEEGT